MQHYLLIGRMHVSRIDLTTNFSIPLEALVVMCMYVHKHYIILGIYCHIGIKMRYILYLHISLENILYADGEMYF